MKNKFFLALISQLLVLCAILTIAAKNDKHIVPAPADGSLKLPEGFGSTVVAQTGARARHISITPNGLMYIKLARKDKNGKAIQVLELGADGEAKQIGGFANYGGTGVYIKKGYLYTSSNEEVFRYKLNEKNEVVDTAKRETIVTGLKMGRQHETKSIVLDNDGNLYVNIGAYSNSCQEKDRQPGSMGMKGCPILDSAGGIWQFKADKANQTYKDGVRYATGLRNVVGLDWNQQTNQLYVMQHGRDQLNSLFPNLYNSKQSAELPAECLYALKKGDDAGWPYMYYDGFQKKKILAPEYGGDGKKEADSKFIDPVVAFPAHLAPNGLLFYTGNMFPERYKNGAFIAFHGSWNRAPEPQAGYYVVFQPFKNGKPSGDWEIFADGFSGSPEKTTGGRPDHKPCGLAQGPDGALYVTDDLKGFIYKITYNKK